ncbi:hypothetical protein [Vibrio sp. STUT-A11]|nr:hypothetical protein [Vibrio sp. STUT-A11]BDR15669.1 hypothetical protein VspSTUT11_36450 [Vibrio sp. STUT-A11]
MKKLTAYAKKYIRKQIKHGDLPSVTAVKKEIAASYLIAEEGKHSKSTF